MRVLCIHPNNDYNIGDLLTYYGSRYIIQRAFNDVEFVQFDLPRANSEGATYIPEYNWGDDIDIILLAGSPWVGPNENSTMKRMVTQARERWTEARTIGLGLGAGFAFDFMFRNDYSVFDAEFLQNFDLIVTRDWLAHNILFNQNIANTLYYDSAVFSYHVLPHKEVRRDKNILIFQSPLKGNDTDVAQIGYLAEMVKHQFDWAQENEADIIVVTSKDKAALDAAGIEGRFVTDLQWLAGQMCKAKSVLSCRVHQAIFAKIMGCPDVTVIPLDSRYLTTVPLEINLFAGEANRFRDEVTMFAHHEEAELPYFQLSKLQSGEYADHISSYCREVFE